MSRSQIESLAAPDVEGDDIQSDESIAHLEKRLQKAEDRLLEERFCWAFAVLLMFNAGAFAFMETWGGPVALVILEMFFLVILARKCGVEDVVLLTNRVIDSFSNHRSGNRAD